MYLKSLNVVNFRNYDNVSLDFGENINIIYGDNAQGKTNLLESIYFLALTKSHRSFIDDNLIKSGSSLARLQCCLSNNDVDTNLKIVLSSSTKKLFVDDNNYKKVSDYVSRMNVVIFYPEDLELIKSGPMVRRHYINLEISQLYSGYMDLFNDYKKLIKMKNSYLKKLSSGFKFDCNYFNTLNDYIIDKSISIYIMRKKFIDKINLFCGDIFFDLCGIDGFNIKYKTSIDMHDNDKERIRCELRDMAGSVFSDEIRLGSNLLGPNFDDFLFFIDDMDLKRFGSQGQQRMAILSVKLAEVEIFKKYLKTSPILLLDDVFSELDNIKKNNLLKYVNSSVQTIITVTDLDNFSRVMLDNAKLFHVVNGCIDREC